MELTPWLSEIALLEDSCDDNSLQFNVCGVGHSLDSATLVGCLWNQKSFLFTEAGPRC